MLSYPFRSVLTSRDEEVKPLYSFDWHKAPITSVEWHPHDDAGLAASSDDNSVCVLIDCSLIMCVPFLVVLYFLIVFSYCAFFVDSVDFTVGLVAVA
jgi:WD40 repeat protein